MTAPCLRLAQVVDPNNPIGRRLTINIDLYTDIADPPLANGVLKLWVIDSWTPPITAYTTMTPVIQDAGFVGYLHHYTATATVSNFDSKARVTLAVTNPQSDLSQLGFTYSAIVAGP